MSIAQIVDVHCRQRLSVCPVSVQRVIGRHMSQTMKMKNYGNYEQTYHKEDSVE